MGFIHRVYRLVGNIQGRKGGDIQRERDLVGYIGYY